MDEAFGGIRSRRTGATGRASEPIPGLRPVHRPATQDVVSCDGQEKARREFQQVLVCGVLGFPAPRRNDGHSAGGYAACVVTAKSPHDVWHVDLTVMARAGLHLGTTAVGRILKEKPVRWTPKTGQQVKLDFRHA